jgi:glycosyltransferase involved in cell wall biosynthesis
MEAAASGLPIVTTSVGELAYLWKDGENALLVQKNDPEQMAAAIKRVLKDPELAAQLSVNARAKAENYDWSMILPRWETLFESLICHA